MIEKISGKLTIEPKLKFDISSYKIGESVYLRTNEDTFIYLFDIHNTSGHCQEKGIYNVMLFDI